MSKLMLLLMISLFVSGVAAAQDESVEKFYQGAAPYLSDSDSGDVYIIYEGDVYIVNPYPDYFYNPCVGCSPWMLENSYPASESRKPLTAPTGRIGTPTNKQLMDRE